MEDPRTVSIIIAVLNGAAELRETLLSIDRQDVDALARSEIIIVDGGSTDGTLDVARAARFPIDLSSEPDHGIYDAMNKGAARAGGRWLQFLNAGDCFATDTALGDALDGLNRAASSKRTWFIGGAQYTGDSFDGKRIPNLPHNWFRHAVGAQPHCHQATWFQTDLFRAMGGYDEQAGFIADFDLILRWGMTGPPEEDQRILIDYLSGGLSERREAEIPDLQRAVRRRRMQIDDVPAPVERAATRAIRTALRVRGALASRLGSGSSRNPSGVG